MKLYLVQHAAAHSQEEDPDRGLTEQGRREADRLARHAHATAGVTAQRIFHSGKLRARQTAEIWQAAVASALLEEAEGLGPLDAPELWAERLRDLGQDIMLVGHLPHLERLTSLILTGQPDLRPVAFENAGVCCLERDAEGAWVLRFALTPSTV